MAKINVLTAFTIRLAHDGEEVIRRVEAGVQEVEDFIAEHWYAKAHTGPLPESMAAFGIAGGTVSGLKKLFMSHPPLEERIAALRAQA